MSVHSTPTTVISPARDRGGMFKWVKQSLVFLCVAHILLCTSGRDIYSPGVAWYYYFSSCHLLIAVKPTLLGGSLKAVEPVVCNQLHIMTWIPHPLTVPVLCVPFIKANGSPGKVIRRRPDLSKQRMSQRWEATFPSKHRDYNTLM